MDDFDPTAYEDADQPQTEGAEASPHEQTAFPQLQSFLICVDVHRVREYFPLAEQESQVTWNTLSLVLREFVKSRIISGEHDRLGIMLFGTSKSDNSLGMDHIIEIQGLEPLTHKTVRALTALGELDYDGFQAKYGSLDARKGCTCQISDVFRYAMRIVRLGAPPNKFQRKILLFTHRPDPCEKGERPVALQLGRDLLANRVAIELFPLILSDEASFDIGQFYAPLIEGLGGGDDDSTRSLVVSSQASASLLSDLKHELKRRAVRPRVLQKCLLQILPGLVMGVSVYLAIQESKKPAPVMLRSSDEKPLYSSTTWLDTDTGSLLAKDEIRKYYELEGRRVVFSDEEITNIKAVFTKPTYESHFPESTNDTQQRMTLLGFKDQGCWDRYRLSIRPQVYCLFPDDREMKGSAVLMGSMLQAMQNLSKIALISFHYRANSSPRLFAGVAQISGTGSELRGFLYLIPLPFADDVRTFKPPEASLPLPDIEAENSLGKALDLLVMQDSQFDAQLDVSNPVIEKHILGLEALALGAEPPHRDGTLPDQSVFDAAESELKEAAKRLGVMRGEKRQTVPSKAATHSNIDWTEIECFYNRGALAKLTVPVLKGACQHVGLPVSGRKSDLIERIESYMLAASKE